VNALFELLWRIVVDTLFQAVYVAGLLAACAVVLHHLDRIISGLLSQAFGWRAVLWTGWIGTPIHELSHAAMCLVFGHRIEALVLYDPDPKTGVLGYVAHSHNPKNLWARIGCAFIGIAPLFGGALALSLARYLLVPSDTAGTIAAFSEAAFLSSPGLVDQAAAALALSTTILQDTLAWENLTSWRFWLFLYLVLCIGTHLAPSRPDLTGSRPGFIALGLLLLGVNALAQFWGGIGTEMVSLTARVVMPVVALLLMAVVLNLLALVAVLILVMSYFTLRGYRLGVLFPILAPHRRRLAVVGAMSLGLFLLARGVGGIDIELPAVAESLADSLPVPVQRPGAEAADEEVPSPPPASLASLCGAPAARPQKIAAAVWSSYACRSRQQVGQRWRQCVRRREYSSQAGRGCPGAKRCCPGGPSVARREAP
jgi:hypothetical protein